LWTVGQRDPSAVDTLYKIYRSYARWVPDDAALKKTATGFVVGAAECLVLQDRYAEVRSLLDTLSDEEIEKAKLRASVDFYYGIAFYRSSEYAAAVPKLESGRRSPRYAKIALPLLVDALLCCNQTEKADQAIRQWVDTCHPPTSDVMEAMASLAKCKSSSRMTQ
jgi:hypothetical protein